MDKIVLREGTSGKAAIKILEMKIRLIRGVISFISDFAKMSKPQTKSDEFVLQKENLNQIEDYFSSITKDFNKQHFSMLT